MMLLSLIFMASDLISLVHGLSSRELLFFRNLRHERKAAGDHASGELPFRQWSGPVSSLKFQRRHADTTRKKSAEAAEAGKTDCHANAGYRQIGQNQQMLGFLYLRPGAILVRGVAKDCLEQPNEMKTRETGVSSHRADGHRLVLQIPQYITSMAEPAQKVRANHLLDNRRVLPPVFAFFSVRSFHAVRSAPVNTSSLVAARRTWVCPILPN